MKLDEAIDEKTGLTIDRKSTAQCRSCSRRRRIKDLKQGGGFNNFTCRDTVDCKRAERANDSDPWTEADERDARANVPTFAQHSYVKRIAAEDSDRNERADSKAGES